MSVVYIVLLCLISAEAVHSVPQNRAAAIVYLYNKTFNFFEHFLSLREIDNLPRLSENISFEKTDLLYKAINSYTWLRIKIVSWCHQANDTINSHQRFNLPISRTGAEFVSIVSHQLNEMKECFDSIETNGAVKKNVESYQAVITFTDDVLKYEVIEGRTPDDIEDILQPLLQRSKSEGNVSLMSFDGKVNHAKSIITEALSVIDNTTNELFNEEDMESMVSECESILKFQEIQETEETPIITPSTKDTLMMISPEGCGVSTPEECVVVLSKRSVTQFLDFYRNDQSLANFFDSINHLKSSVKCKDLIKSYIRNHYLHWAFKAESMKDGQFMRISMCLNSDSDILFLVGRITIEN